jgi:hypothetical protein
MGFTDGTITVKQLGWGTTGDNSFMSWGAVLDNTGPDVAMVDLTATGFDKMVMRLAAVK